MLGQAGTLAAPTCANPGFCLVLTSSSLQFPLLTLTEHLIVLGGFYLCYKNVI